MTVIESLRVQLPCRIQEARQSLCRSGPLVLAVPSPYSLSLVFRACVVNVSVGIGQVTVSCLLCLTVVFL